MLPVLCVSSLTLSSTGSSAVCQSLHTMTQSSPGPKGSARSASSAARLNRLKRCTGTQPGFLSVLCFECWEDWCVRRRQIEQPEQLESAAHATQSFTHAQAHMYIGCDHWRCMWLLTVCTLDQTMRSAAADCPQMTAAAHLQVVCVVRAGLLAIQLGPSLAGDLQVVDIPSASRGASLSWQQ